jgi:hypothetical protein
VAADSVRRLRDEWQALRRLLDERRQGASDDWVDAAERATERAELAYRRAAMGDAAPEAPRANLQN